MRITMLAFFCLLANPVHAAGVDADSCSTHLCFRPQGCSHCGSAPLIWMYAGPGTEISGVSSNGNWKLGVELGYLTNMNEHHALGFTLFGLYWDETGNEIGARFVYR